MSARAEHGFTLVEVLLTSVLMVVVLSAALMTLDHILNDAKRNDANNDMGQAARQTSDNLVRQLRNLASPTGNSGSTIAKATSYDFTFQTADPSRTWVRYCLLTSGTATPNNASLYLDTTTAATPGSTTSCPGTGWATSSIVVQGMTNVRDGRDRPIFSYVCLTGGTTCVNNASTFDQITRVDLKLWVDPNGTTLAPREQSVTSAVYLRNQNQAPVAQATMQPVTGQARTYFLNGSGSSDPEGRTLRYFWFRSAVPNPLTCTALPPGTGTANYLGQGITLTTALSSGSQSVYLVVCDPGDRPGISSPMTVTVP